MFRLCGRRRGPGKAGGVVGVQSPGLETVAVGCVSCAEMGHHRPQAAAVVGVGRGETDAQGQSVRVGQEVRPGTRPAPAHGRRTCKFALFGPHVGGFEHRAGGPAGEVVVAVLGGGVPEQHLPPAPSYRGAVGRPRGRGRGSGRVRAGRPARTVGTSCSKPVPAEQDRPMRTGRTRSPAHGGSSHWAGRWLVPAGAAVARAGGAERRCVRPGRPSPGSGVSARGGGPGRWGMGVGCR